MADQFKDRFYRLTVNFTDTPENAEEYQVNVKDPLASIVITGHHIEFEIERNLKRGPNQCSMKITNLNEATRTAFKQSNIHVALEAGYASNYSLIFSGDVTYALSEHDGTEWVTHLDCADGDRMLASARISRSYKAGTTVRSILVDAYKSLGQKVPDNVESDQAFSKVLPRGYTAFGEIKSFFTTVLKPLGFSWSVQDGQVQILSPETTTNQVFTLSSANAMIGSPEFGQPPRTTKKGKKKHPTVTVKSLLYPQLRPGAIVELQARDISGQFKLLSVKHKGSFHGKEWITEVEINPLSETTTRTNQLGGNPTRPAQR